MSAQEEKKMMTWMLTKCQTMKKDIWKEAIVGHAQSLHRVLPTFLKWASELVKGSPSHAAVLYELLFDTFTDPWIRQQVKDDHIYIKKNISL